MVAKKKKIEKCFFCGEKFIPELGRWLEIYEIKEDEKTKVDTGKLMGKSFVCFQCEEPCSHPPEFNDDGSLKQRGGER